MEPLPGSSDEFGAAAAIFEASYGDTRVVEIWKNTNAAMVDSFEELKAVIEARRGKPCEEMTVFHGTSFEAAKAIMVEGFDPSRNTCGAYGLPATYCSPSAKLAEGYTAKGHGREGERHIFICRLAVGKLGRAPGGRPIDTDRMDTSGDAGTKIYATPHKYGLIPTYLIRYV